MKLLHILWMGLSLFLFMACDDDESKKIVNHPNTFSLKESALYPETVVYSLKKEKSYIGSYFKGKIITLDLLGNKEDFIVDDSLVAVVGMTIDEVKNQLIVCNSDSKLSLKSSDDTYAQLAKIIIYDLDTAKKIKTIDLSKLYTGGHFLNDVTLDSKGNIYVTDSFSPIIYKIDQEFKATILVESELFNAGQGRFGLNGIVYHSDNFLIVGMSDGSLFKVSLGSSSDITSITLDKKLNSLDGILLKDKNSLLVVSNNIPAFSGVTFKESVTYLESKDSWLSADTKEVIDDLNGTFPTTLTQIDNDIYLNFGEFPKLIEQNIDFSDFKLQKIIFSTK